MIKPPLGAQRLEEGLREERIHIQGTYPIPADHFVVCKADLRVHSLMFFLLPCPLVVRRRTDNLNTRKMLMSGCPHNLSKVLS